MTKLDNIKRLCLRVLELDVAATKGPWSHVPYVKGISHNEPNLVSEYEEQPGFCTELGFIFHNEHPNAQFIAKSRSFSPAAARALLDIIAWAEEFDVVKLLRTIESAFPDELLEDV